MNKLTGIHAEDCIKGLSRLPEASVDLAFADPPFNIGYTYDVYDDRRQAEDYLEWSQQWISGVLRVLKPNGTFWLAIGDEFAAELKVLSTRDLGFHCRNWVVWFYTFGVHCTHKFTRSHAHLFYFVKDPKNFTFNSLDVRVPSARELVYGDKRADPRGRVPDDTWMMPPESLSEPRPLHAAAGPGRLRSSKARRGESRVARAESAQGDSKDHLCSTRGSLGDVAMKDGFILRPQDIPDRFPTDSDTWYFSRVAGTFSERRGWHGCQMPEQLLGRIIRACSNEGDLVLDPFGGSGTTLAVAKKLRRKFLGFELSTEYARQIEERLASIKPGDPLTGPANPLTSAPKTSNGRVLDRKKASSVAASAPLLEGLGTPSD
jgi:DNA modification methylase